MPKLVFFNVVTNVQTQVLAAEKEKLNEAGELDLAENISPIVVQDS